MAPRIPRAVWGVTEELGVFTAADLGAGGINRRGFLQPLLPQLEGVDERLLDSAGESLADRGLLRRGPSGWRAAGRYRRLLEAGAVARSVVVTGPADPDAPGFGAPRLTLGCLGLTGEVLDLWPGADGYRARLLEAQAAAVELAEFVGELADRGARGLGGAGGGVAGTGGGQGAGKTGGAARGGVAETGGGRGAGTPGGEVGGADGRPGGGGDGRPVGGGDGRPVGGEDGRPVERGDGRPGERGDGRPVVRVEAASISHREGPLLQQRLTLLVTDNDAWFLLGTRRGNEAGRSAAPVRSVELDRVLGELIGGRLAAL